VLSAGISSSAGGPRWCGVSGKTVGLVLEPKRQHRKSQLAIEHCYRTAEQSPETWVFWAHISNTARLEQSYQEIAEQVKVGGRKDPQADVFKLVHDWLRSEKNGPWLLVLDNADDAAVLSSLKSLPPSRHGSVLVTSRTNHAAMQVVEDRDIIPVKPMHNAAAHALLRKKLGDTNDNDNLIPELATVLEYMPLALVQAAAYIRKRAPRCSVRQYLEEYRQSDSRKASLLNEEAGHLRRDKTASNSVLITWQISFDYIRSQRQSAADLLSLMSFFDRQGIHESLLHSQNNTGNERVSAVKVDHMANDRFEDDVLTLRDYSFITVTRDANTFEMHSLIQLATHKWLENQSQLDKWREQFISNLCAELPTGQYENWGKCQALYPHVRAALAQRPKDKEPLKEWALLLYKAAWYACETGRAGDAEHMSVISMEVRRWMFGENDVETLDSMGMVGLAMDLGGRLEEAELINRQTLARTEKVLGPEHPDTLTSMSNLAGVLISQGKYEEAESMNRQTLARTEKVLGPEHPDTLTSMSNLALVLISQGKYEEAESMNRQTLARTEKVLGPEHPNTLMSMSNLAGVLERQGKYEEAESMNRQTLARREKVLGPEHPDTLTSMSNLAGVLERQGKYEEAESMNRQTLARREKVLGPEHPDTLMSIYCLAHLLADQNCYSESLALYERACAAYQTVLGTDHPTTRACRQHYAEVKMYATEEHDRSARCTEISDSGVRKHIGKASKLTRGLAKIGLKISKSSTK
jgi:hypothetical protein